MEGGQEPLLRARRPHVAARRLLGLAAAALLCVGLVGVAWHTTGSSVKLLGWDVRRPTPEQRKIEREMR